MKTCFNRDRPQLAAKGTFINSINHYYYFILKLMPLINVNIM